MDPARPGPPPAPHELLEETYRRTYRQLVGMAALLTGSREAAEDLVHDAFVRCEGRLGDVDDPATYLRAAVANACRSWHRRRAVARRAMPFLRPRPVVPERLVEFDDALRALPEDQRVAVVLRVHGGFTAEEIASLTGANPSTVRTRIQRGLAALRTAVPRD